MVCVRVLVIIAVNVDLETVWKPSGFLCPINTLTAALGGGAPWIAIPALGVLKNSILTRNHLHGWKIFQVLVWIKIRAFVSAEVDIRVATAHIPRCTVQTLIVQVHSVFVLMSAYHHTTSPCIVKGLAKTAPFRWEQQPAALQTSALPQLDVLLKNLAGVELRESVRTRPILVCVA